MSKNVLDLLNELHPEPTTTGSLIRAIRKNFNITQKDIEELTGIKEPNLSAIENDKVELTKKTAEILGAALGMNPASLLFPEGTYEKSKEIKEIERRAAKMMAKKRKAAGS